MTEHNRESCGDGLFVCKDSNGDIGLQFSRQAYFINNAAALKLLEWLMKNVTIPNDTVAVDFASLVNWKDGVTVTDTLTIEHKEPTE